MLPNKQTSLAGCCEGGFLSFYKNFDWHAYRRGGTFEPPKVPKSGLGQAPRPQTHRNARSERLRRPEA